MWEILLLWPQCKRVIGLHSVNHTTFAFTLAVCPTVYNAYLSSQLGMCPSVHNSKVMCIFLISCLVYTLFIDFFAIILHWRRNRSASAMMGYRRDYDVLFPGRGIDFCLHHSVETACSVKPASLPMGAEGSFPVPSSKVVPLHAVKTYRGRRCIALLMFLLGTRQRSLANFTPRPLYPGGKLWYQMNRRLGKPQSRSGLVEGEKFSCPWQDSNARIVQCVVCKSLYPLNYPGPPFYLVLAA
jgi:hypothetical protein